MTVTEEHDLYRHFDNEGNLLYVGISINALNRLAQHDKSRWINKVANVTIEKFPDRKSVLAAEKEAIQIEKPIYNIVHNLANITACETKDEDGEALGWLFNEVHRMALAHYGLTEIPDGTTITASGITLGNGKKLSLPPITFFHSG